MSGLQIIVTQAGRQALVNAQNTGTLPVQVTQIGVTAQAFTPVPGQSSLPGEIKRLGTFAGAAVADDTIHVTIRDDSPDTYTLRGFGLYLQDGTLFAVYSQAGVILEKSAQAMLLLAADVRFVEVPATALSFGDATWINPPATAEVPGVVELATAAEATTGADSVRAVTPAGVKAAMDSRLGLGAPSNYAKGLIAAANAGAARETLGLGTAATKNEGEASGLDADLLDGQHGSYYRDWGNLTNKPTAFPPIAHGHAWSDLTGVPATASRWPAWSEVTGKPSTFAPSAHSHAAADVTSGTFAEERIPSIDASKIGSGTFSNARISQGSVTQHQGALSIGWNQLTGVPGSFPPLAHSHQVSDVSGLQASLEAKVNRNGDSMTGGLTVPSLTVRRGPVATQQVMSAWAHEDGVSRAYQVLEGNGNYAIYLLGADGQPAPNAYQKLEIGFNARTLRLNADFMQFAGRTVWDSGLFDPSTKATLGEPAHFSTLLPSGGNQGFQVVWNTIAGGLGRNEYICNRGTGEGGHYFYARQANTDAPSLLGGFVANGSLLLAGGAYYSLGSHHYFDKQVQANGGFQVFSSRLTKRDIEPIQLDMAALRGLRPVRYRYRDDICDDGRLRLGLIAEEVAVVLPEPVVTHGARPPTLDYDQLAAPMIAWLQLLDARLTTLETARV